MARLRRRPWAAGALACALGVLALLQTTTSRAEDDPSEAKDPHRESIFALIAPRGGEVIADVGCGKGTWTFPLARAVGNHGKVMAVDIDRKKTLAVKKRMEREGVSNVEVIHSRPDDPMLATDSLDAVFVNDVIDHVDRSALAGFLAGIRSALKPSGRLIIRDPNGGPGRVIAECYRHGFTLIDAKVPLEDSPRRSFTSGWYALKLQRADRMPPALLPRHGKPDRRLTRLHLAEELFRRGVLTRKELRRAWERIENAPAAEDADLEERLDLIAAAEAVDAIPAETAKALRARVQEK